MNWKKLNLFFFVVLCFSLNLQAQKADEELAAQYLGSKEYEKAADKYEHLLNGNPKSMYFYDNLLKSYLGLNDFGSAQKLVKKQIRKFEGNYYYLVDEGYLLKLQNQNEKANQTYQKLVNDISPIEAKVYELAKAFEKRKELDMAIETYLKARKQYKNELLFSGELGGLYQDKGKTKEMIDEYLNVLLLDETMQVEVQGQFQNTLSNSSEFDLLKLALNKKSKQYPEKAIFQEMSIWMYVQKSDYEMASLYAKNLDRKNKEDGRRLIELGFLASSNENWDAAISIYKQVQLLGKEKPYYTYAKNSELESRSKKLLSGNYPQIDLQVIEQEYVTLLQEFGSNAATANTLRNLAHLRAFYMNKYADAVLDYESLISMPRVDRNLQAQAKLELGDLYILKGEVWDAMLVFGQVDKDFLEEPIGQEAKYRNARLSYYMGEFDWAKAQLDVLKTATTQLIANNALELSLLIQDNTIDSTELEPLKLFASADLNLVQNNLDKALQLLDSLKLSYPKTGLNDDILCKKAEIAVKRKNFNEAANYFKQVVSEYGSDILGDNALYQLARLQQFQLNQKDAALISYEQFISQYPGSFFLNDCRKQYRILRGDQLN
jgi:tetratricopeptide (TPR) repeat protein